MKVNVMHPSIWGNRIAYVERPRGRPRSVVVRDLKRGGPAWRLQIGRNPEPIALDLSSSMLVFATDTPTLLECPQALPADRTDPNIYRTAIKAYTPGGTTRVISRGCTEGPVMSVYSPVLMDCELAYLERSGTTEDTTLVRLDLRTGQTVRRVVGQRLETPPAAIAIDGPNIFAMQELPQLKTDLNQALLDPPPSC